MMAGRTPKRRQRQTVIEVIEQRRRIREVVVDNFSDDDEGDEQDGAPIELPRQIRLQTGFTFGRCYRPPDMIVDPVLRSGTLFGLTAATGTGKTGLMLTVALAVAAGRSDLLGMPVKQGRVIFVAVENPAETRARLIVTASFFDVLVKDLADQIVFVSERCSPEELLHTLGQFGAMGEPIGLILVDGYSAMFDGRDMNSATEAPEFLRRLRPLTRLLGSPAILISMHPGKAANNDELIPTGSGMLLAELDVNLGLRRNATRKCVELHWAGKIRGLDFTPIAFSSELATHYFVVNGNGEMIPLPVMRRHEPSQPEPLALTDARQASPSALVKAMVDHPDGPQRTWAAAVGCSQAMVGKHLKRLEVDGLAASLKGRWTLTEKGREGVGK